MDPAAIYAAFAQLTPGQQETLLLDLHDAHYNPTYETYRLRPAGLGGPASAAGSGAGPADNPNACDRQPGA